VDWSEKKNRYVLVNNTNTQTKINEPTEDYANYQRNPNEEMPQEYYENPPNPNAPIDDDEQEDYENVKNALSKANMDDTEEQEDYENYTFHHDEGPSEDYEKIVQFLVLLSRSYLHNFPAQSDLPMHDSSYLLLFYVVTLFSSC
jgi:hypothetical protein